MTLLKRLWQWYSSWRVERQTLKGHGDGGYHSGPPLPHSEVKPLEKAVRFTPRPPLI